MRKTRFNCTFSGTSQEAAKLLKLFGFLGVVFCVGFLIVNSKHKYGNGEVTKETIGFLKVPDKGNQ